MKIPKIKVCNPSPFTKNVFCDVIDETMSRVIWNHVLRVFIIIIIIIIIIIPCFHSRGQLLFIIYLLEQKKAFT